MVGGRLGAAMKSDGGRLFELTIVGSLVDPVSGRAFSWRPSETYIAVEVASGALVRQLQTWAREALTSLDIKRGGGKVWTGWAFDADQLEQAWLDSAWSSQSTFSLLRPCGHQRLPLLPFKPVERAQQASQDSWEPAGLL